MQRVQNANLLSQHYYHENFNELITFVISNYAHLLDQRESHFFATYHSLSQPAQQLYCRFLMRKRDYIRASKTTYSEIVNADKAITELVAHGLCTQAIRDDAPHWAALFRREEIQSVLPLLSQSRTSSWIADPDQSRDLLLSQDLFGFTPADLLLESDTVYRVELKDAFTNYILLFFGDLYQDLSAFILRDLGFTRFETTLHKDLPLPFDNREQLLAHRHYYLCIDSYDDSIKHDSDALLELHQHLLSIPPEIVAQDSALKRRVEKLSNRIARQLERLDAIDEAASIYQKTERPPARERLARIKAKQSQQHEALAICKAITDNPLDAAELDFAEQFAQPLAKALNADFPRVKKYNPPQVSLTLPTSALSVEYATALHYAKTGKCFYVENSLITGVFGLAIWDIIFAPVKGAFYHPFQTGPADFQEPEFTIRRRTLIKSRMQDIQRNGLGACVLPNLHDKRGINNPLVNWYAVDRQLVILALEHIPLTHWLYFFEHLLCDIPAHRSGLPDLIFFADTGGYELLEVKGPGDQLQKNQRRWMKHFAANDIPHAVVNVDLTDNKLHLSDTPDSPE